jgi:hypothetical protein
MREKQWLAIMTCGKEVAVTQIDAGHGEHDGDQRKLRFSGQGCIPGNGRTT